MSDLGIPAALAFVQIPMRGNTPAIAVKIHRGETRVVVSLSLGSSCALWLREVFG